jgi:Uma2 family endonuclease
VPANALKRGGRVPVPEHKTRVWVIDPDRRIARIYRQDGTETMVREAEPLDGEDVLLGFSCPLASIL